MLLFVLRSQKGEPDVINIGDDCKCEWLDRPNFTYIGSGGVIADHSMSIALKNIEAKDLGFDEAVLIAYRAVKDVCKLSTSCSEPIDVYTFANDGTITQFGKARIDQINKVYEELSKRERKLLLQMARHVQDPKTELMRGSDAGSQSIEVRPKVPQKIPS